MIPSPIIGACGLLLLLLLLFFGLPIGLTMATVGLLGLLVLTGIDATFWSMQTVLFHESFHWVFIVLPMFFLLGNFAFHGDVGKDAYETINKWLGRFKGSLLIATIFACAAMGFASGSSLATAGTFTRLALPEMRRHDYNLGLACGAIACSGTLAALIPPSGMMVIFAVLCGSSLGKLMIAGILPGILTAVCFVGTLRVYLFFRPEFAPVLDIKIPLKEKIKSLKWVGPLLLIIVCILGGLYAGVFTPTEAGAMGALVTLIFFILRKGIRYRLILESLMDSIRISCMIFIIIIGAMFFSRFLAVSGFIDVISKFLLSLPVPPHVVLIAILFIYLILGTFMEAVAIMVLTLPIFFPILTKLGFDEALIGIVVLMLVEIGVTTPPLGTNVYVVKSAAGEDVTLEQIFKGIFPFFIAYLFAVALVITFPQIALFLPKLMS
ncbi:MAG TPA: TRAP transporter large permease [Desulfatiglandales bacterium]|nr:TRAP transporter large permease [Desulfatiglandales bacterium]